MQGNGHLCHFQNGIVLFPVHKRSWEVPFCIKIMCACLPKLSKQFKSCTGLMALFCKISKYLTKKYTFSQDGIAIRMYQLYIPGCMHIAQQNGILETAVVVIQQQTDMLPFRFHFREPNIIPFYPSWAMPLCHWPYTAGQRTRFLSTLWSYKPDQKGPSLSI